VAVPNFHLRGIPPELYERLRERADANGRSINAEILAIVSGEVEREPDRARLLRDLRRLRREVRLPADAPPPEQLIREDRDERTRRL
jgi:plasmid stability protein